MVFKGGKVKVDIKFNWKRNFGDDTVFGNGLASGLSDVLAFAV